LLRILLVVSFKPHLVQDFFIITYTGTVHERNLEMKNFRIIVDILLKKMHDLLIPINEQYVNNSITDKIFHNLEQSRKDRRLISRIIISFSQTFCCSMSMLSMVRTCTYTASTTVLIAQLVLPHFFHPGHACYNISLSFSSIKVLISSSDKWYNLIISTKIEFVDPRPLQTENNKQLSNYIKIYKIFKSAGVVFKKHVQKGIRLTLRIKLFVHRPRPTCNTKVGLCHARI